MNWKRLETALSEFHVSLAGPIARGVAARAMNLGAR
jgi:hypothetical protein